MMLNEVAIELLAAMQSLDSRYYNQAVEPEGEGGFGRRPGALNNF